MSVKVQRFEVFRALEVEGLRASKFKSLKALRFEGYGYEGGAIRNSGPSSVGCQGFVV